MATFIALAQTAKPLEEVMTSHGFSCPTKDEVSLKGVRLPRNEACPLTALQDEVLRKFWANFELAIELSPQNCGLMRGIMYTGEKIDYLTFPAGNYLERAMSPIGLNEAQTKYERINNFMRLSSYCFHEILQGTFLEIVTERGNDSDKELLLLATKEVAKGINTAHMYSFGAADLIDDLVCSDYSFARGKENTLYKQVNDFFRYYSYVSAFMESEFKRCILRTPEEDSFSAHTLTRLPYDFSRNKFAILNGKTPRLAIDNEIIEKIKSMEYLSDSSRRACPAIFVGILPQYLDWVAGLLRNFHWKEAA